MVLFPWRLLWCRFAVVSSCGWFPLILFVFAGGGWVWDCSCIMGLVVYVGFGAWQVRLGYWVLFLRLFVICCVCLYSSVNLVAFLI